MSTATTNSDAQTLSGKAYEGTNRWISGPSLVLYIAALALIVQLLVASRYGFFVDELYLIACSHHLAWGYVDQPPFIVLIAFIVRHTLGESLVAFRFIPALAGALLVWTTGSITREIGGGKFAQALSAIAVLVTPAYLMVHHHLTMNAIEPLLWAGCAYFVVRCIKRNATSNWIWLGAIAGLGLENKYTIGVFLFGLAAGLLLTPARRWLLNWQPWAAGGLAVLVFTPNLLWQYIRSFPFLEWQRTIRASPGVQTFNFSISDFFVKQALLTLPVFVLWLMGAYFFLVEEKGKSFRFLGFSILVVLGVAARSGKPWYAIPIYAIAFTGGAVLVEGLTERFHRCWLRSMIVVAMITTGAIMAPCFIPILPVERVAPYQRSLGLPLPVRSEFYERNSQLAGFMAWEFGWNEMVAAVAQVYNSLPEEEKPKVGVFAVSYGEAGAVDLLGKKYGLPKAICGQLAYHSFGPRNYTSDVLIFVGPHPSDLGRICKSVQKGATLDNPYGYDGQRGPVINVCRGLVFDLQRDWPAFRHY